MLFKNDYYYHLEVASNKKLKLLLKDIIIKNLMEDNFIFLWLDDFDINNEFSMNIIYDLLEFDRDICIIS